MWKTLKSWLAPQKFYKQPVSNRVPSRLTCEVLEDRINPARLFLEFGDNFGPGGLQMTETELRSAPILGPDLRQVGVTAGANLTFTPLRDLITFDYNEDGVVNGQDYTDLRTAIVALVTRVYEPFNVDVIIGSAATRNDVINALTSSPTKDEYVFCTGVTPSSGSIIFGLFGIANIIDIDVANNNDNASLVFPELIFPFGFDNELADTQLASTIAHEAGHNFGLKHIANYLGGVDDVLTQSEVIAQFVDPDNGANFQMATRYPLAVGDGNTSRLNTRNSYNKLATDPNVGLRPGGPAYVTGTGAFDIITLTSLGGTTVQVDVRAFANQTFTTPVIVPGTTNTTVFSYTIDTTNGILVDAGDNNDRIVINGAISGNIKIRGMAGQDELIVNGGAATGMYIPRANAPIGFDGLVNAGGRIIIGSAIIDLEEFELDSNLTINNVATFTVATPSGGDDNIVFEVSATGAPRVRGMLSTGVPLVPINLPGTATLIIDGGDGDDTITANFVTALSQDLNLTIQGNIGDDTINTIFSSVTFTTNLSLNLLGGAGDDTLAFTLPATPLGGVLSNSVIDGGTGNDNISVTANADFTLSDASIQISTFGTLMFQNFLGERATLIGGDGVNSFTTNGWSGVATLDGGNGSDFYTVNLLGSGVQNINIVDSSLNPLETDTVTVVGSANDEVFDVNDVQLALGNELVSFNDTLERIRVNGGAGADGFRVTPSQTIVLEIDGAAPFTSPGDTISLLAPQVRVTRGIQGSGILRSTGNQDVIYRNIERVILPRDERFGVSNGPGQAAIVQVYNGLGTQLFSIDAFPTFTGGARVASGDLNGDGVEDIVAAALAGGGPHVRAFDGVTGAEIASFFAYTPNFSNGMSLAVGDVNGDGFADIITGAGPNGGPHVMVFSGQDFSVISSFFAYNALFTGGVDVAAGDMNGDGLADIFCAAGFGGGPHVIVVDGFKISLPGFSFTANTSQSLLASFFAFDATFAGGVAISVGDINGDGVDDIFVSVKSGMSPIVRVISGANQVELTRFNAFDPSYTGGVRTALLDQDSNGQPDALLISPGADAFPVVRAIDPLTQQDLFGFFAYDPTFLNGVFVG